MSDNLENAGAYGLPVFSADTPVTAESLNKLSEGITSAMQNLETRLSKAGGTVNGPLEVAGGLTRAGNAVYDTGNKPTAADVGALSKNGDTAIGRMTFSGNAEIYDGKKETYIELGKSGEKTTLEFHFGDHSIDYDALIQCYGNGDSVGLGKAIIDVWASELRENGVRVYNPNNLPDRARIQNENEMNLANGFAKDDGQVYINNRDTVKPIKRYSLCNGQGTKEQAELSAKAIYEGDTRVYSPNNKPTPTAIGALYERNCFSGPLYGYYHFGNLLIQWDVFPFNTSGKATKTIYLPIAYSDTNYSVVISHYGGSLENDYTNAIKVQSLDTNWFQVKKIFSETSETISWIAIGIRR